MTNPRRRPLLYMDTNVILDIMDQRRQTSQRMFERIVAEDIPAFTSVFTFVELIEAKQSERWGEKMVQMMSFWQVAKRMHSWRMSKVLTRTDRARVYEDLRQNSERIWKDNVPVVDITPDVMKKAEEVRATTSIEPADSIHLGCALYYNADYLITTDRDFEKMAKVHLPSSHPDNFNETLESLMGNRR